VGSQGIGTLFAENGGNVFRRDGFDVSAIRSDGIELQRIGHNRSGIGVDEYDFVTFLAECFAGLRPGVIELAGLTNDDRTRSNDGDSFDVCALQHGGNYSIYHSPLTIVKTV
jgi:hypothetical protein